MTVKTWVADELVFKSTKKYDNPFEDVDISAVFTFGKMYERSQEKLQIFVIKTFDFW